MRDSYCRLKASTVQVSCIHTALLNTPSRWPCGMSYPNNSSSPSPQHSPHQVFLGVSVAARAFLFNIAGLGAPWLATELRSRFCEGSRVKPSEFIFTFDRNQTVNFQLPDEVMICQLIPCGPSWFRIFLWGDACTFRNEVTFRALCPELEIISLSEPVFFALNGSLLPKWEISLLSRCFSTLSIRF